MHRWEGAQARHNPRENGVTISTASGAWRN